MGQLKQPDETVLARFADIVGPEHVLTEDKDIGPYQVEERQRYIGKAAAVLRPSNVQQVAGLLKIAHETQTRIVPQGGNTGLVGAQVPDESGTQVVLSLSRLNKIRNIDPDNNTITVDAGVILTEVQNVANEHDRLFPMSLGAEGSCQIGGNIGSNAGGVNVLAYGNTRDLVLGLEVVLADGRIWDGMRALRKDNTGYDLKNLFIGSEGTLGVITGAVLKLFAKPRDVQTAFVGLASVDQAIKLLHLAQAFTGGVVTSFELISQFGLEIVLEHIPNSRAPLAQNHPWYVLFNLSGGAGPDALAPLMPEFLAESMDQGLIEDATIAQNDTQRQQFWHLRENLPEAQNHAGGSIKHDISVPISEISNFLKAAENAVHKIVPGCHPLPFGHIGDGNVHYNITQPEQMDKQEFLSFWDPMNRAIYDVVRAHGGSISAEHGIGQMKRDYMPEIKSEVELDMMRGIKGLLDPDGILNPGKLLPPEER